MSAGVTYQVVVEYLSKGDIGAKRVATEAQSAQKAAEAWAKEYEKVQARRAAANLKFTNMAFGGLDKTGSLLQMPFDLLTSGKVLTAAAGAATAMGGLVYQGIKFNEEIETARIGLAGIFQAQGIGDFQGALGASESIIKKMQRDAAVLPGTFKELLDTFQAIATPGLQAGMNINQTEDFAAKTLAIGVTSRLAPRVAAREMAAMLRGQTHSQNILAQLLLPQAGVSQKEFNQMSAQKRLETLNKVFDKYGDSLKSYDKSFQGIFTTTTSNLQILLGKVTKPVFEDLKNTLDEFNRWFKDHGPEIDAWATRMGDKLHHAFTKAHDAIKGMIPTIVQLYDRLADFMSNGGIEKIEKGLGIIGGMKLGGMALKGASSLAGTLGPEAALGALEAAALPATAALLTTAGAIMAVNDTDYIFHKQAVDAWMDIQKTGSEALARLSHDAETAWSNLQLAFSFGMENLGVVGLGITELVTNMLNLGNAIGFASHMISVLIPGFDLLFEDRGIGKAAPNHRGLALGAGNFNPYEALLNRPGVIPPPQHHTTIHNVNINIRNNDDPSRIGRAVNQHLRNLVRNPQGGSTAPRYARY